MKKLSSKNMSEYWEQLKRLTDYSLYYTCLVAVLTITGFITGILGLLTIFGFKYTAVFLGLSGDVGYYLLDKITLVAFIIFYIVYQYAGIRVIYKEGLKDMAKNKKQEA